MARRSKKPEPIYAHTPGPWRWRGYYLLQDVPAQFEVDADEDGKETNPYATPCGAPIACDGSAGGEYGATIDINGPDAKLIAAAPDLLEALETIVPPLLLDEPDEGFFSNTYYAKARAAIAKAKGISLDAPPAPAHNPSEEQS